MRAAHNDEVSTGLNKKTGMILIVMFMVLVGIVAGFFVVQQVQNPQKSADEIALPTVVTGPSCPLDGFICSWNRESGVSYHYSIRDDAGTTVKEGDIPASSATNKITITYSPEFGKTYTCLVSASNECGQDTAEGTSTCSSAPATLPTTEETPTPVASESAVTTTPSSSPTPTTTSSMTYLSTITPTISPTLTPPTSGTPAITDIVIINASPTPKSASTSATPTRRATLPVTGISSTTSLAILLTGFLIVILGLAL